MVCCYYLFFKTLDRQYRINKPKSGLWHRYFQHFNGSHKKLKIGIIVDFALVF